MTDVRRRQFLERKLPNEARGNLGAIERALDAASHRYERLAEIRSAWENYSERRRSLEKVTIGSHDLLASVVGLDPISRDDLAISIGPEKVETLQGYLFDLWRHTHRMSEEIQATGRPRDLAEERWVHEVADIYENNFQKRATISGSGSGPNAKRGNFYALLHLSMPASYPRFGKLHPKQLLRILKRRSNIEPRASVI